ncbi:MAG: hypothetical protein WC768_01785 [Patescibacteria group bacterium]|jgi:hypothetical protein
MAKNDQPKKKFQLDELPESTKKNILVISVTLLTITIFSLWLFSLKFTLFQAIKKPANPQLEKVKNELSDLLNSAQKNLETTQTKIDDKLTTPPQTEPPTAPPQLSPREIEQLKQKILETQAKN